MNTYHVHNVTEIKSVAKGWISEVTGKHYVTRTLNITANVPCAKTGNSISVNLNDVTLYADKTEELLTDTEKNLIATLKELVAAVESKEGVDAALEKAKNLVK